MEIWAPFHRTCQSMTTTMATVLRSQLTSRMSAYLSLNGKLSLMTSSMKWSPGVLANVFRLLPSSTFGTSTSSPDSTFGTQLQCTLSVILFVLHVTMAKGSIYKIVTLFVRISALGKLRAESFHWWHRHVSTTLQFPRLSWPFCHLLLSVFMAKYGSILR